MKQAWPAANISWFKKAEKLQLSCINMCILNVNMLAALGEVNVHLQITKYWEDASFPITNLYSLKVIPIQFKLLFVFKKTDTSNFVSKIKEPVIVKSF